jgi:hypothetical protein
MAKETRLRADYIKGVNGLKYDVEICSDAGFLTSSSPYHEIQALPAGGLVFSYDSGDLFEPFQPIVSGSVSLTFFATHDSQLQEVVRLARGGEKSTYAKIRIYSETEEKFWFGVYIPEETKYELIDGRTLVSLKFADGLKMLSSFDFLDLNGDYFEGMHSALFYANQILRKLPWVDEEITENQGFIRETPFLDLLDWVEDETNQNTRSLLRRVQFLGENYYGQIEKTNGIPTGRETDSCEAVLIDICLNFGYKIAWNGTHFHFFSPLNYTDDAEGQTAHPLSFVWARDLTTYGSGYEVALGVQDSFSPSFSIDEFCVIESGALRVFSNGYKEARITHKHSQSSNILGASYGLNLEGTNSAPSIGSYSGHFKAVPDYQLDAGGRLTARIAATLQINPNGINSDGVLYYVRFSLKVGNYYLSGPASSQFSNKLVNFGGSSIYQIFQNKFLTASNGR